jgi:hypothetical protein
VNNSCSPRLGWAAYVRYLAFVTTSSDEIRTTQPHAEPYPMPPAQMPYPMPPAQMLPPPAWPRPARDKTILLAVISIALGIPLTGIVAGTSHGATGWEFAILLVIWAAIAVINVSYARRRS